MPVDDDIDFELLAQVMMDGYVDVDCTAECGYSARVEPDANYPCHECKEGRLVSPMVEAGII